MDDGDEERAGRAKDASNLADCGRHILDLHQHVVSDGKIETHVRERERGGGRQDVGVGRVLGTGGVDEGGDRVGGGDVPAARPQQARDASLATADVECRAGAVADETCEAIAVGPEGVMIRRPGPGDPLGGETRPVVAVGRGHSAASA